MQKCSYCGAEFPERARFCGNCGRVPEAPIISPFVPLTSSVAGSGAPTVAGTPQINTVPTVQGMPQATPLPAAHSINGASAGFAPSSAPPVGQAGAWQPPLPSSHVPAQSPPEIAPDALRHKSHHHARHEQHPPHKKRIHYKKHIVHRSVGAKVAFVAVPKWIVVTITALVIAGGGAGAFALVYHSNTPTTREIPTATTASPTHGAVAKNSTPVVATPSSTAVSSCNLISSAPAANVTVEIIATPSGYAFCPDVVYLYSTSRLCGINTTSITQTIVRGTRISRRTLKPGETYCAVFGARGTFHYGLLSNPTASGTVVST